MKLYFIVINFQGYKDKLWIFLLHLGGLLYVFIAKILILMVIQISQPKFNIDLKLNLFITRLYIIQFTM